MTHTTTYRPDRLDHFPRKGRGKALIGWLDTRKITPNRQEHGEEQNVRAMIRATGGDPGIAPLLVKALREIRPRVTRTAALLIMVVLTMSVCLIHPPSARAQEIIASATDTTATRSFDWTPMVVYTASAVTDQWSTHRFLTNGSGCTEANRFLPGRPSDSQLTAHTISFGVIVLTASYLSQQVIPTHVKGRYLRSFWRAFGRGLPYSAGAAKFFAAGYNVGRCRGRS